MKKLLFVLCMMCISTASFAQKGTATVGAQFNYIIDSPHNLGAGVNVGYEFLDNVRAVAGFDYYFKKDYVSWWGLNLNAEYLFRLGGNKVALYPIVGLNVMGCKVEGGGDDSKVGLNLGAGVEVPVSSFAIKAEYIYKTQWDGSSFLNVGVVFPF